MTQLPMPSEVKKAAAGPVSLDPDIASGPASASASGQPEPTLTEPPGAKLVVRLFLIPLMIVAGAVGVMFVIGLLVGGTPSIDDALSGLKESGGQRTGGMLVGPGSKQRYMYAKALADQMKDRMAAGMGEADRLRLAAELMTIVDAAQPGEGDVKHFLLLALGRTWQIDPRHPAQDGAAESSAAAASRRAVVDKLLKYARAAPVAAATEDERRAMEQQQVRVRKAAVLALAYLAGRDEVRAALPVLADKVGDRAEDVDVRMAAATVLGPLATPADAFAVDALRAAKNSTDRKEEAELVWCAALSLAELNQPDAADEVLKLLTRDELARMEYLDRETDPKNPTFQKLGEAEQERILINTMIGASRLDVPRVQAQIRKVADADPSPRVREAGREVLGRNGGAGATTGRADAQTVPPAAVP